jgi:molybdopterin synthase catalytic subunit
MSPRLTVEPLNAEAALAAVGPAPEHGAQLLFVGVTRAHFDGRPVVQLEYEAYAPLAEAELAAIIGECEAQWPGARVAITHRLGVVPLGEASVIIAVATPHRDAAYAASRYAIEALKARVPIWKKEVYTDGSAWKANAPS